MKLCLVAFAPVFLLLSVKISQVAAECKDDAPGGSAGCRGYEKYCRRDLIREVNEMCQKTCAYCIVGCPEVSQTYERECTEDDDCYSVSVCSHGQRECKCKVIDGAGTKKCVKTYVFQYPGLYDEHVSHNCLYREPFTPGPPPPPPPPPERTLEDDGSLECSTTSSPSEQVKFCEGQRDPLTHDSQPGQPVQCKCSTYNYTSRGKHAVALKRCVYVYKPNPITKPRQVKKLLCKYDQ